MKGFLIHPCGLDNFDIYQDRGDTLDDEFVLSWEDEDRVGGEQACPLCQHGAVPHCRSRGLAGSYNCTLVRTLQQNQ